MDYQTVIEYVLFSIGVVLSIGLFVIVAGLALLVSFIIVDVVSLFIGRNKHKR